MKITNEGIEDVIAVERKAHKCNERLIDGTVSNFDATMDMLMTRAVKDAGTIKREAKKL